MPGPVAVAAAVLMVSVSGLAWVWRLWPRTRRHRGADARPGYARFHSRPAAVPVIPGVVACDWGHCEECTGRRYGQVHVDGSFTCGCGHRTPAGVVA